MTPRARFHCSKIEIGTLTQSVKLLVSNTFGYLVISLGR